MNGSFYEFQGPLYDQSGKLRVKKGVKMDILKGGTNSLYGMNWLVKGVIGSAEGLAVACRGGAPQGAPPHRLATRSHPSPMTGRHALHV